VVETMSVLVPLAAVAALFLVGFFGSGLGLEMVFGVVLPYVAAIVFVGGFVYRVLAWANVPVPFRIPTTCGQQKSLSWIENDNLENPHNTLGVIGRMFLEIFLFRSLLRNTRTQKLPDGRIVYGASLWLWLGAIAFHGALLVVLLRHLRFFLAAVPFPITFIEMADGFLQVGVPVFYATSFIFLGGLAYLLVRRFTDAQVRYISLASDYFPLFLLLAIGVSGFWLRHLSKTDVVGIKELAMGWVTFSPSAPEGIHSLFYGHLFLVCALAVYFPFSKLMHMPGVFLSPARNMANSNRAKRHINPWNHPVKVHSYEEFEDDFRDKMKAAGIEVEKE